MKLLFVLYMNGVLSGILPTSLDRQACEMKAATETLYLTARGDTEFKWACEERGPDDMIWRLHPEWRN